MWEELRATCLNKDRLGEQGVGVTLEPAASSSIHRTTRGELVRSKSEVIIANLLHALGITYAYEQPFTGTMAAFDILTSRLKMRKLAGASSSSTLGCFPNQHIDAAG